MTLLKELYKPAVQQKIIIAVCISIAITLVWWPLLNSIAGAVLFFFWLFFCKKEFSLSQTNGKLIFLFTGMYVLTLIGFFNSSNTGEAMFRIQQKSAIAMFPLVLGTTNFFTAKSVKRILWCFSATVFLMCLFLLGNGLLHYFQTGTTARLHGYEMNFFKDSSSISIAVFCTFAFSFHLFSFPKRESPVNNQYFFVHTGAILFYSCFLFFFGNRMSLILILLFFLFFIVTSIPSLIQKTVFLFLLIVFSVTAVFTNPSLQKQVAELTNLSSQNRIQLDADSSLGKSWGGASLRIAIWTCSWDFIKKNWVTGAGTGDVQDELQKVYDTRKFYFASRYNLYNAHNQYLQQLLANGILGMVLLIGCIAVPLFPVFTQKRSMTLYTAFLLIFAFVCLTESFLEINKGIVWYSFFNSIFVFSDNQT